MHSRMKFINRWALMRNTSEENLSEHSNDVAVIAHALALIKNLHYGGSVNPERAAFLGLFHDMPEIITGDMPTPVKHGNEELHEAFLKVETAASQKLLNMLPEDMRAYYTPAFFPEEKDCEEWKLVKAADKISALIKCIEEGNAGNKEFIRAGESTLRAIQKMNMPEADEFVREFIPSFSLSLDEQSSSEEI